MKIICPNLTLFALLSAISLSAISSVHAEETVKKNVSETPEIEITETITFPKTKDKSVDWMRLKSGEYLEGEIKSYEDDELHFDSEVLDDIEIDIDDIDEFYSPKTHVCLFEIPDRVVVEGQVFIKGDSVLVKTPEEVRHFSRKHLVRIIAGKAREINYWKAKANLGLQVRSGNTDKVDLTSVGNASRKTPITRFLLDYNLAFGRVDGVLTTSNVRAQGKFDYLLSRKFFITPASLQYYRDPFQNIEHRITPGAGFGYDFFNRGDFEWNATALGAYQYERYDSVPLGTPNDQGIAVASLETRMDWEVTKDVDWNAQYQFQIGITDPDERSQHAQTTVSYELLSWLDLDVTLIWDRVANPKIDINGIRPGKDDFQFLFGIGVELN